MNKNIDIKNLKAAKRYANALTKSAIDCIDEVYDDLDLINKTIFNNNELKTFFFHPVISLKDKKEAITLSLQNKINPKTYNFILALLDENRFSIFKTIFEVFKTQKDIIKNTKRIEVISAIELDEAEKSRITDKLQQKLNKNIILTNEKDENILGGLVIKLEDKVIDLSLKSKFEALKQN